jgi:Co/Zn/Cd efflux system component
MKSIRNVLRLVAILNLAYFFIEFSFALKFGSVSLLADSIDFLEDASINILIFIGLSWTFAVRARLARFLAILLLVPVFSVIFSVIQELNNPSIPSGAGISLVATGALVINFACSFILAKFRKDGRNLVIAAYLSARNDAITNVSIIIVGILTIFWPSSVFDIAVGVGIGVLNSNSAIKVWRSARTTN